MNIREKWKNASYRSKGMTIGVLIGLLIGTIFLIDNYLSYIECVKSGTGFLGFIFSCEDILNPGMLIQFIIFTLPSITIGLFGGGFLGKLYEKTKHKRLFKNSIIIIIIFIIFMSTFNVFNEHYIQRQPHYSGYNTITECENQKTTLYKYFSKDTCIHQVAIKLDNIEACEKIQDEKIKKSCFDAIAITRGNLKLCEKIQDLLDKDLCYSYAAKNKNDSSLCENMSYDTSKDFCYLILKQCEKIKDYGGSKRKENCYTLIKVLQSNNSILDSNLCNTIEDPFVKDECLNKTAININILE